jgi:AcrR family transcriptional regulator
MDELRNEPRQRRSRETIDAILDAAEALIHQRGQVSFTAHELAAASNMSVGRVYYWFPDIPSVVAALGERGIERLTGHFSEVLDRSDVLDDAEFLPFLATCVVNFFEANPAVVVLVLTGGSVEDHGRAIRTAVQELAAGVFAARSPAMSRDEQLLLGRFVTTLFLATVREFAQRADEAEALRRELGTMLVGWAMARAQQREGRQRPATPPIVR